MNWKLRLNLKWNVIKESWPYIWRHPIRSIVRWWAVKRAKKETLNKIAYVHGVQRRSLETDEQLRLRILTKLTSMTQQININAARLAQEAYKAALPPPVNLDGGGYTKDNK